MTNKLTTSKNLKDLVYRDLKNGDMFRFVHASLKSTYMKIYPDQVAFRFVDLATGVTWSGTYYAFIDSPLERVPFLTIEAQGETQ
jgi:hypothetical protein